MTELSGIKKNKKFELRVDPGRKPNSNREGFTIDGEGKVYYNHLVGVRSEIDHMGAELERKHLEIDRYSLKQLRKVNGVFNPGSAPETIGELLDRSVKCEVVLSDISFDPVGIKYHHYVAYELTVVSFRMEDGGLEFFFYKDGSFAPLEKKNFHVHPDRSKQDSKRKSWKNVFLSKGQKGVAAKLAGELKEKLKNNNQLDIVSSDKLTQLVLDALTSYGEASATLLIKTPWQGEADVSAILQIRDGKAQILIQDRRYRNKFRQILPYLTADEYVGKLRQKWGSR